MHNHLYHYISELLYRYDCVIVPGLGGFVSQKRSAHLDKDAGTISPPSKFISFNELLNQNDGILVHFIAEENQISYQEANKALLKEVEDWKNQLKFETLYLPKIGWLKTNNHQKLEFEPELSTNYLTESFGLSHVKVKPIAELSRDKVKRLPKPQAERKSYALRYAAILVIGIGLSASYLNFNSTYQAVKEERLMESDAIKTKKIEKATFPIQQNLPSLNLSVEIKKEAPSTEVEVTPVEVEENFFVIGGAFRSKVNAEKFVKNLNKKGYKAAVLAPNKWGLHQVSYGASATRSEADKLLIKVRKSGNKEAWVLSSN